MTVQEFFKQKAEILYDKTQIIIIDWDDAEECEQIPLDCSTDSQCCPYCLAFGKIDETYGGMDCSACPLHKEGDGCNEVNSTYRATCEALGGGIGSAISSLPEIRALVDQYNYELGEI